MSFVNSVSKEVNCKIVYVGTGLSGKTTNVQYIYENTQNDRAGKLVSLSTENERTLFFDFLPLSVGEIRGYKTRFHLYTIPGQTFYEASRDFIFKGCRRGCFRGRFCPRAHGCKFRSVGTLPIGSRETRL